jgi:hypothetical protein
LRKALTGLGTLIGPYGEIAEKPTFTCAHCQRVRRVDPYCDPADLGGLCKVCMGVVCEVCVGKGCDPFEEKLRRIEARARTRRWMEDCE